MANFATWNKSPPWRWDFSSRHWLLVLISENNETTAQEAVDEAIRAVWCSGFEGRCSLKQWTAAIREMRASGQFAAVNNVWACAMKMLIHFLTPETSNDETLDVCSALGYITVR